MYLDVAAGYFQRVHIVTESTQRGHLLAGLTHIARDYVNRKTRETAENNINAARPHDGLTVTRETPVFEVRSDFSLNHEENCTPIPEIVSFVPSCLIKRSCIMSMSSPLDRKSMNFRAMTTWTCYSTPWSTL